MTKLLLEWKSFVFYFKRMLFQNTLQNKGSTIDLLQPFNHTIASQYFGFDWCELWEPVSHSATLNCSRCSLEGIGCLHSSSVSSCRCHLLTESPKVAFNLWQVTGCFACSICTGGLAREDHHGNDEGNSKFSHTAQTKLDQFFLWTSVEFISGATWAQVK